MNYKTLSLFHQFEMEVLRRFVEDNPQKASELVLSYYQEYHELYQQYKVLQQSYLESFNDLFM
ncbi:MAG: hypothetical protein QNJ70_30270 [Xenococcaceae cyanobacterium MO_207.B15]|nr:hypothetical protein [Xenococcaceae cyanobacterium MO_207.B15]